MCSVQRPHGNAYGHTHGHPNGDSHCHTDNECADCCSHCIPDPGAYSNSDVGTNEVK